MGDSFLDKLTDQLKRQTIEQYLIYSLDTWENYIDRLGLKNENIVQYITNKDNILKIEGFINENGILGLQYNQDQILKRHIIGFDYDISIRKAESWTFEEYFKDYREYLVKYTIKNILKLKLIFQTIAYKMTIVPRLAVFDTIENDVGEIEYNISYSGKISESLIINMRGNISEVLAILSNDRSDDKAILIEEELADIWDILSEGLFSLIIYDRYPRNLENILPEAVYKKQIEDRILKNEISVRYDGELYRAIKLDDSYVVLNSELHAVTDTEQAKAIYCKVNLAKSMLR
ncbi:hypothetical protein Curi_c06110 [Gottschalkia acidurici 9a]|uniref:Uncharacterized protein n=1 Tax=Gottschalkia acidurici (strain ATCC 7906 / DSM 604 / BCRC 14475 / CIP 104303 / KCTC 5404 / NCIMB 10678 / 9a) TaxID=1128398 RepID=K0AWS1_GOTA9|nr:hypothetical protein [Gottschalkia acidurici]AFS77684.1 hypothetical protein Curi_c06110 [Gottschalkia acidurici 9a]